MHSIEWRFNVVSTKLTHVFTDKQLNQLNHKCSSFVSCDGCKLSIGFNVQLSKLIELLGSKGKSGHKRAETDRGGEQIDHHLLYHYVVRSYGADTSDGLSLCNQFNWIIVIQLQIIYSVSMSLLLSQYSSLKFWV